METEFAGLPLQVSGVDGRAFAFAIRAQLVGQVGLWSVTPFFTLGAGTLAVSTDQDSLGADQDEVFHLGLGAKIFVDRYIALRVDFRNNFTSARGADPFIGTSHQELLLGLSATLGRDKNEAPPDADKDGVPDANDKCPEEPGVAEYEGCPIPDTDGDTVLDPDDKCPDVAGSPDYQGREIPDSDGDGILDPDDKCPDQEGVAEYEGCPIPDTDGDGLLDPDDKCPDEPETKNSYEDEDGCPDEIPEVVKSFVGVIEGIYFDTGKATIRKKSEKTLDDAVKILLDYPKLRLEISGHTDDRGKRPKNLKLSHDRAESVKAYMVEKGVGADRLEVVGFGPDKPVDSNDSKAGRQKNRRIEFRLLRQDEHAEAEPGADAPKAEPAKDDAPTDEAAKDDAPKAEPAKDETAKAEPAKDAAEAEPAKDAADKEG